MPDRWPQKAQKQQGRTSVSDWYGMSELEDAIQRLLIDFVNRTGREIDHVRVDTRNFANLSVEIVLKETKDGRAA